MTQCVLRRYDNRRCFSKGVFDLNRKFFSFCYDKKTMNYLPKVHFVVLLGSVLQKVPNFYSVGFQVHQGSL